MYLTPLSSPCLGQAVRNALYLSDNVFSTKVLTEDTIYTSSTGDVLSPFYYENISDLASEGRERSEAKAV